MSPLMASSLSAPEGGTVPHVFVVVVVVVMESAGVAAEAVVCVVCEVVVCAIATPPMHSPISKGRTCLFMITPCVPAENLRPLCADAIQRPVNPPRAPQPVFIETFSRFDAVTLGG